MRDAVAGKHKGWRSRWQVDFSACTATHDTGLVVSFSNAPSGSQLFGAGSVTPANLAAVQTALEAKNGLHNTPIMLRRLASEASRIYQEATGAINC
ncbi:MAG: hypothetical protein LBE32_05870 [Burkholderiales bacterium]|jgi:hypothetical protein|nr:hypothetical protein [Burkholderiales bacterium]